MKNGHAIMNSYSSGKDSSTTLDLTFRAALELKAGFGHAPPIFITHADTGVENPEIAKHAKSEIQKIKAFVKKHRLEAHVHVAKPDLYSTWPVQVIGGRFLPIFANMPNRACTVDFKVNPMRRLKKGIIKQTGLKKEDFITLLGTRFDESTVRGQRMEDRKETDDIPWHSEKDDGMALNFIANSTTKNV